MDTAGEGELRALELDADDSNGAFASSRCRMTKTRGVIQASRVRAFCQVIACRVFVITYQGTVAHISLFLEMSWHTAEI